MEDGEVSVDRSSSNKHSVESYRSSERNDSKRHKKHRIFSSVTCSTRREPTTRFVPYPSHRSQRSVAPTHKYYDRYTTPVAAASSSHDVQSFRRSDNENGYFCGERNRSTRIFEEEYRQKRYGVREIAVPIRGEGISEEMKNLTYEECHWKREEAFCRSMDIFLFLVDSAYHKTMATGELRELLEEKKIAEFQIRQLNYFIQQHES